MIFGSIRIEDGTIVTHKQTFALAPLTYFEVERPLRIPAILLAGAFGGFTIAFADLLYAGEIAFILGASAFSILIGLQLAQLRLHGADFRGTAYGHALWGRHASLQKIRAEIAAKINATGGNQ